MTSATPGVIYLATEKRYIASGDINTITKRLLTPVGRFDRSAIMRQAWAAARAALVPPRPIRGFTPAPRPTLREAFADALRRAWDLARGQRACIDYRAVAEAETVRRSALPDVECHGRPNGRHHRPRHRPRGVAVISCRITTRVFSDGLVGIVLTGSMS